MPGGASLGLRRINAKRMYRLAKGYRLLLQRYSGTPPVRIHDGVIAVELSDEHGRALHQNVKA